MPTVGPPTISATPRCPAASARAVVDPVALPIEQQVNGVDGMIYMQSYSASDGSYTLIVTFKIGMEINFAQVVVENRVCSAHQPRRCAGAAPRPPRPRAVAAGRESRGRTRPAAVDGYSAIRHLELA